MILNTIHNEGQDKLVCQQCNSSYMHISEIRVMTNKITTIVDNLGTHIEDITLSQQEAARNRGSIIEIYYWCENCHDTGVIQIKIHKGELIVESEMLENIDTTRIKNHDDQYLPDELWRD